MKPGEIYRSYKRATNRKEQIRILADLNAVTEELIERIVSEEERKEAERFEAAKTQRDKYCNANSRRAGTQKAYEFEGQDVRHIITSRGDSILHDRLFSLKGEDMACTVKTEKPAAEEDKTEEKGTKPEQSKSGNSRNLKDKDIDMEKELETELKKIEKDAINLSKEAEREADRLIKKAARYIKAAEEALSVAEELKKTAKRAGRH